MPATQLQPSSPPRPRTRSTSPRSNEVDRSPAAAVLARCRWIEPPRLRTAENPRAKRRARSLELFFDLVFVVVVDKLAELLADDPSAVGVLCFLLLFATVCVTWVGYRIYADRFDTGDVLQRVLMLCGMLAVAAVAVNIRGAFTGGSAGFAIAYVAVRVVSWRCTRAAKPLVSAMRVPLRVRLTGSLESASPRPTRRRPNTSMSVSALARGSPPMRARVAVRR